MAPGEPPRRASLNPEPKSEKSSTREALEPLADLFALDAPAKTLLAILPEDAKSLIVVLCVGLVEVDRTPPQR